MLRLFLIAACAVSAFAQPDPREILARVSEEAEMFRQSAPKALAEETLEQRALLPAGRGPRIGKSAAPRFVTRELLSEYSVGKLKDAPAGSEENLYEFRQVISVDGRKVKSPQAARHALSLDLQNPTDRIRKRMLEDFEKHGIPGAAVTDFGTILLLFCKRLTPYLELTPAGETRIGADAALVLAYRHTGPLASVLDFKGRQTFREPLHGQIMVRKDGFLPLRVTVVDHRKQDGHDWVDQAAVDYAVTQHGFLAPVSVTHARAIDGRTTVENRFRYAPFRLFGASAEIKFTEVPELPPGKP